MTRATLADAKLIERIDADGSRSPIDGGYVNVSTSRAIYAIHDQVYVEQPDGTGWVFTMATPDQARAGLHTLAVLANR